MESRDWIAQRTEGPADHRHSVEPSCTLRENTFSSESVHGFAGLDRKSQSKNFIELRQVGAVDFNGTTECAVRVFCVSIVGS